MRNIPSVDPDLNVMNVIRIVEQQIQQNLQQQILHVDMNLVKTSLEANYLIYVKNLNSRLQWQT